MNRDHFGCGLALNPDIGHYTAAMDRDNNGNAVKNVARVAARKPAGPPVGLLRRVKRSALESANLDARVQNSAALARGKCHDRVQIDF